MRLQLITVLSVALLAAPADAWARGGGGGHSHSSKSSSSSSKPVHVKSYTNKHGKTVRSHDRASPGSGVKHAPKYTPHYRTHSTAPRTFRTYSGPRAAPPRVSHLGTSRPVPSWVRSASTHAPGERDSHGRLKRSESAKNAFKHSHPCPSTGRTSGACPGYVIDHIRPLKRGGADEPSNMQWQTVSEAKAKDKWE